MLLFSLVFTGCGKNSKSQVENKEPQQSAKAESNTGVMEEPQVTGEEGTVFTDSNQITGLAKQILSNMTLEEKLDRCFLLIWSH